MAEASGVEVEPSKDVDDSDLEWSCWEDPLFVPIRFNGGNIMREYQSSLHLAILHNRVDVAVNLIRQGADVNAINIDELTPLHYAIWKDSYPAVCMLLYYNADVRMVTFRKATPWGMAVERAELEIASLLINYYSADDAVLMLAKCVRARGSDAYCKLLVDAIEAGGDVTCEDEHGNSPLIMSLTSLGPDLFKLMWSKCNYTVLVDRCPFFLLEYITKSNFAPPQWLDCLYLILESDVAVELALNNKLQSQSVFPGEESYLFNKLLLACRKKAIDRAHLVELIYILLSFGIRVSPHTFELVHLYYGFGAELDAILSCANYCGSLDDFIFHIPRCLIAVKADLSREEVPRFFFGSSPDYLERFFYQYMIYCSYIESMFGFFAVPQYLKCMLLNVPFKPLQKKKRLCNLPDVPSLVELSRNQARVFITQVNKVKQVHQFYDALRRLNYPQLLKDVICLKEPIYYIEPELNEPDEPEPDY